MGMGMGMGSGRGWDVEVLGRVWSLGGLVHFYNDNSIAVKVIEGISCEMSWPLGFSHICEMPSYREA